MSSSNQSNHEPPVKHQRHSRPHERHSITELANDLWSTIDEYFPEALRPLIAALAVAAVGCIKDASKPTALILVAPSGAGKTMALGFLMPMKGTPSTQYFYRSDDFTVHSFVSHKADATEEELREIDLLPKLKDKTLITKELAPLFRGKEVELEERFAKLTSILDGQGYTSDSGAHGQRGYPEAINFRWLGATTPLSNEALRVMANLGPRILFFSLDRDIKDTEALTRLVLDSQHEAKQRRARRAVQKFVEEFFARFRLRSVDASDIALSDDFARKLALLAKVTSALRTMIKGDRKDEAEHPERVLFMLKHIAIGSVLINGRNEVTNHDMGLVRHIATSSGPWTRQKVFRALLSRGGRATTPELESATGLTAPTVLNSMRELHDVGLATFLAGKPGKLKLAPEFEPLARKSNLKPKGVREAVKATNFTPSGAYIASSRI